MSAENDRNIRRVTAFYGKDDYIDREVTIRYTDARLLGNGSFGVVYQAKLLEPTNEWVAVKKIQQDRRFKPNEEFLNLVLEFLPDTIYRLTRGNSSRGSLGSFSKTIKPLPLLLTKVYVYQMLRALAYIHSMGICHRDVKPQNLLVNSETAVLKLCDFGSAKYLIHGEPNVSYICSRFYRAPELIFGASDYSTAVDIWSGGCVFGELLLGKTMFTGESGIDQLVEIIKVLGTPNQDQIRAMNPNYAQFTFPKIKSQSFHKYFDGYASPEAIALISVMLEYSPKDRVCPLRACTHPFFDELRTPACHLPNGRDLPPLFNFTQTELEFNPELNDKLIPPHVAGRK